MTYSIKDRLGWGGDGFQDYTHRHVHWFGCGARWTLVVDVHIIFLAGQSSPILAVHNGAAGDTRCFSLRHSERQGHPDRLNWIDLSLFGPRSAGLPSPGPAVYQKFLQKRARREGKKIGKRASRENHFSRKKKHIHSGAALKWRYFFLKKRREALKSEVFT